MKKKPLLAQIINGILYATMAVLAPTIITEAPILYQTLAGDTAKTKPEIRKMVQEEAAALGIKEPIDLKINYKSGSRLIPCQMDSCTDENGKLRWNIQFRGNEVNRAWLKHELYHNSLARGYVGTKNSLTSSASFLTDYMLIDEPLANLHGGGLALNTNNKTINKNSLEVNVIDLEQDKP